MCAYEVTELGKILTPEQPILCVPGKITARTGRLSDDYMVSHTLPIEKTLRCTRFVVRFESTSIAAAEQIVTVYMYKDKYDTELMTETERMTKCTTTDMFGNVEASDYLEHAYTCPYVSEQWKDKENATNSAYQCSYTNNHRVRYGADNMCHYVEKEYSERDLHYVLVLRGLNATALQLFSGRSELPQYPVARVNFPLFGYAHLISPVIAVALSDLEIAAE